LLIAAEQFGISLGFSLPDNQEAPTELGNDGGLDTMLYMVRFHYDNSSTAFL